MKTSLTLHALFPSSQRHAAISLTSLSCLLGLALLTPTSVEAKGKPLKSAPVSVTFDVANTYDGSANAVIPYDDFDDPNHPNDGNVVTDGVDGTQAMVGSSFDIIADLLNSSRALTIALPSNKVVDSTGIKAPDSLNPPFSYIQCGQDDFGDVFWNDLMAGGSLFSEAKFRVLGRDYLKLAVGSVSAVNADLEFYDTNGFRWQLRWGPYEHAGSGISYNPGSDPVEVTRVDANTWTFTTTGLHHAALYRYEDASQRSTQRYYGQFAMPVSGSAVSLQNLSVPNSTISEISVLLTPPEVQILEPGGDQSLPVNAEVDFLASASDHCLDISEGTIWTVNGTVYATGSLFTGVFPSEGIYLVEATAQNRSGALASDSVTITIGNAEPPAGIDNDGDGWTVEDGDCDDNNPKIHPGANDTKGKQGRDGIDNDCNGVIDG